MGRLAPIDWAIVLTYLLFTLLVGLWASRSAGRSLESYFVAGRSLPWWWLGTSMAATTFAADTPLVVAGLVAKHGVAGNWFWWSWALSHVSVAIMFAAQWRRAGVLTDAELIELRYEGRSATILRVFKAAFFAVLLNAIILGWVVRAMVKIAAPFVDWQAWIGPEALTIFEQWWPSALLIGAGANDTLTVLALFGLVAAYSTMGGIRGVILTDLVQFALALAGGIVFAWYAVDSVGGLSGLHAGLARHYDVAELLSFVPSLHSAWLPVQVFLIYIAVQWWAQYYSDGSGYLAQRLFTARNERHASAGALWFVVLNYAVRSWPWILVALVALVVYPLQTQDSDVPGAGVVVADREMAYPVLMAHLLPAGLLGLLFVSLLAAFMSTVDTHLNWGASYVANDFYRRFIRPDATERQLVRVSRLSVLGLALMGVMVASRIDSIEQAWRFFVALGAGLGLPSMMRWLWWRANAWTEIVGLISAVVAAAILYLVFPGARAEYLLLAVVAVSTITALLATFLTAPVSDASLRRFVARVRPVGYWPGFDGAAPKSALLWQAAAWGLATAGVFGLLFGVGEMLLGTMWRGVVLSLAGAGCLIATLRFLDRIRSLRESMDLAELAKESRESPLLSRS